MKFYKLVLSLIGISSLVGCSNLNSFDSKPEDEQYKTIFVYTNYIKLTIELENNSSVDALVNILKEINITYSAHDYGGFEKVGNIGYTLPQNNTIVTTEPGDVILYQGTSICLYYGTNTWPFTKIGHIYNYSQEQLKEILKADQEDIEITLSLY